MMTEKVYAKKLQSDNKQINLPINVCIINSLFNYLSDFLEDSGNNSKLIWSPIPPIAI